MAEQTLYEKIIRSPKKLHWGDFFKGLAQKHTAADADYAMIAGTTLDSVQTETGMVQKWQRPWLYRRFFVGGMAVSLLLIAAVLLYIVAFGNCINACLNLFVLILPPCIIPVTLMVFFWEMNAPRNISLLQLLGYFFTGGVLSLFLSLIFFRFIASSESWIAPFAEEPGKFLIAALFIGMLKKKRGKIYGLNGLTIGAAVGAGFAAFETAQYCFEQWGFQYVLLVADNSEDLEKFAEIIIEHMGNGLLYFNAQILEGVLLNVLIRSVCALASHVLFCASYSCIFAYNLGKKGGFWAAVLDGRFLAAFAVSFVVHMAWNAGCSMFSSVPFYIRLIPAIVILWYSALRGVRLSFAQIAEKIQVSGMTENSSNALTSLRIRGLSGVHAGIGFKLTHSEVSLGSDASCQLSYPVGTPGIFPKHCKLLLQNGALYLADLGSQSGTFLNGTRLKPMKGILLKQGDVFWLGSENEKFMVV